jgi:glycosyltransferase involved in cell wall biosynthesis
MSTTRTVSRRTKAVSPISSGSSVKPDRLLRALVMSHSHPKLTKGGAEIAAYTLFQGLQAQPNTAGWFLGCSNGRTTTRVGSCISQPFSDSEYIYNPTTAFDYFKFSNPDPEFPKALHTLITKVAPDIVHSHHYTNLGLEAFCRIKKARPETKILLTLHEYLAICHNHGQMVKAQSHRLCHRESLTECKACFPNVAEQDFFLRKKYIAKFFSYVDHFVAPSRFLAGRYIDWGIPASRISVLENLLPSHEKAALAERIGPLQKSDRPVKPRLRVGFFGQVSPLKGINVLLKAAKILHERRVRGIFFDIYGGYDNQPVEFREAVMEALREENLTSNVIYHGPYENEEVCFLMQMVDVVVVPSIWWENSPIVIREALYNRRPVVCSNVGGMAEKVRPGLDGVHFNVGDALSLAAVLEEMSLYPAMLEELRASGQPPTASEVNLQEHIRLYRQVLAESNVQ